jgi:hypothetical protein
LIGKGIGFNQEKEIVMSNVEMLKKNLVDQVAEQARCLFAEQLEDIFKAYQQTLELKDDGEVVKFPVNIGVKMSPCGDGVKLQVGLSYSVKHATIGEPAMVSGHPELFERKENVK